MHSLWIALAIFVLGCYTVSAQEPLTVKLTPESQGPVDVEIGNRIAGWTCEINRGVTFSMQGSLEWLHKMADGSEHLIAKNVVLEDKSGHYNVSVVYDLDTFIKSTLIIASVRAEDQGKWICRVSSSTGSAQEVSKELNIIHDMESMEMQVGSAGPYTNEMTMDVEFNEGRQGVKCDVKGGNPEAVITMSLDGQDVRLEEFNSIQIPDAALPSFHTIAQATVDLTGDHTGKALTCTGQVGNFPARSVAIELAITTFSPTIHCQNKTTSKGDKFVQANCVVLFTKLFKNVSLEVGDSNKVILPNTDYGNGDTKFITEQFNSTAMKVTIDVYQMQDHHFRHVYYINVFGHDNKLYREPIIFINAGLNEANGASSFSQSLVFLSVCLVMLGLLQRLHW